MPRPAGGYFLADGTRVPSVTTIIGRFKDSSQLMYWANNEGLAGRTLYQESGKAADVGTLAHKMVEARIKGLKEVQTTTTDPELIVKARQAFSMYEEWARQSRIVVVETEVSLVSEEYKFGGTGDAIVEDAQQRLALAEWKSANGVYVDFLIQMAANGKLWNENHPDRPLTGGFHLLRFGKDNADFAHHYFSELHDAWEQFRHFRATYELDKLLKKRVG